MNKLLVDHLRDPDHITDGAKSEPKSERVDRKPAVSAQPASTPSRPQLSSQQINSSDEDDSDDDAY